jgi:hypothetical protein
MHAELSSHIAIQVFNEQKSKAQPFVCSTSG